MVKLYEWSKNCKLVSWGGYDMRQIIRDCKRQDIDIDTKNMSDRHINFKKMYAKFRKLKREVGVSKALRIEKLKFIGTPHRGIDDAANIKVIYNKVILDK